MPRINPTFSFWLGVVTTIMIGIGGGTVHLTHMVPDAWIPSITAWAMFGAFVNSAVLTALHGMSSNQSGPLT
jgi:predicted benzoate:H+ symporter BenE